MVVTGDMSQSHAPVTDVKEDGGRRTGSDKRGCKRTKRKVQLVNFLTGIDIKSVKQEL